jgi:hypothetical protein
MASRGLIGNRLALAGTVLYFLEWVAIAFLPAVGDGLAFREDAAAVAEEYRGDVRTICFGAGWFAFVLLGRILFMVALRKGFRDSGRDSALLDFAVGAMTVSVVIEVSSFGPVAAAAWLADGGGDASTIAGLDAAGTALFALGFVPIAVAVLAAAAAMLASGLFPRWVGVVGAVAGAIGIVGGILNVMGLGDTGGLQDAGEALTTIEALGFWVWMIASSIILWRHRTPETAAATSGEGRAA